MHSGRVAVRAGVLGAVAVSARGAAAGVRGRARGAVARAHPGVPRHAADARSRAGARHHQCAAHQKYAHTSKVDLTLITHLHTRLWRQVASRVTNCTCE